MTTTPELAPVLAVGGGRPVRSTPIRTSAPVTAEDVAAGTAVLASGSLSGPDHPAVVEFERELAAHASVPHALAVNSGTAAIHTILQAIGIGRGDEVIVPAHTFIATATPVLMLGATPVVVDVDPATYCIDPAAAAEAVTPRTKAIVAVHINGHPAPVDGLPAGIPVVSDACQAHGASLHGIPVGALGVAGAYSFWQDKLITSGGEGGAVLTADAALADEVRSIRSHALAQIPGSPDFHHVALGYNYRLTGAQGAMGATQLRRLPGMLAERKANAAALTEAIEGIPGVTAPVVRAGADHVFWKYVVSLDEDRFEGGMRGVMKAVRAEGVGALPRYPVPMGRQPVIAAGGRAQPCPVGESLAHKLLMLPLPALAEDAADVADVATALRKVCTALAR